MLFLSDDWVAAIDAALTAEVDHDENGATTSEATDNGSAPAEPAVIRYAVGGGPDGTGPYDLVLVDGRPRARRPDGEASVTLSMDWELAVAINQGLESAQGAFLDGRITIGGDPQVLLNNADVLGNGNVEVAALRSNTVYERS